MRETLQSEVVLAAQDAVHEAHQSGALAHGDTAGAATLAALRTLEMTLVWIRTVLDRELR